MKMRDFKMSEQEQMAMLTQLKSETQAIPIRASYIIGGLPGAGKTSLLTTGPRPIRIYGFDMNCLNSKEMKKGINEGWIHYSPFWIESTDKPQAYEDFENVWMQEVTSGFLNNYGTVAIDTNTNFMRALANYWAKENKRENGQLAIQDYQGLYNNLRDIIKITQAMSEAYFALTTHLIVDKNEVTGAMETQVDTFKQLRSEIPGLFPEKYMMVQKGANKRVCLTAAQGKYGLASTQMGGHGLFEVEEQPDLKYLLKKAGMPYEDNKMAMKALGL